MHRYPIIVPNTIHGFEAHLGRTLMAFDVHKIEAVLGYQQSLWRRKGSFATFVEHGVYNYISNNSLFDNNARLARIMKWVEKTRTFSESRKDKKKTPPKTDPAFGITHTTPSVFAFWPYPEEKLDSLYAILLREGLIKPNDKFKICFKSLGNTPNATTWTGTQIQLLYLLYLLYKLQTAYQTIPIYTIAQYIFRIERPSYNPKGLNTTINQLKDALKLQKLTPGLRAINLIIEEFKQA